MSPAELKTRSLALAQEQYFDAEAVAEALMVDLHDAGTQFLAWGNVDRQFLADLQGKADAAEARRVEARRRMLYTFCDLINTAVIP